jgi:hypothetical protein
VNYELLYWPEADDALTGLENAPELAPVLRAVDRTLVRLADDPFSPRLGMIAFMTDELGGISATPARMDDWYILWQRGGTGVIEVVAILKLPV